MMTVAHSGKSLILVNAARTFALVAFSPIGCSAHERFVPKGTKGLCYLHSIDERKRQLGALDAGLIYRDNEIEFVLFHPDLQRAIFGLGEC